MLTILKLNVRLNICDFFLSDLFIYIKETYLVKRKIFIKIFSHVILNHLVQILFFLLSLCRLKFRIAFFFDLIHSLNLKLIIFNAVITLYCSLSCLGRVIFYISINNVCIFNILRGFFKIFQIKRFYHFICLRLWIL